MSREAVMMFAGGWSVGGSMRVVHCPSVSEFFMDVFSFVLK